MISLIEKNIKKSKIQENIQINQIVLESTKVFIQLLQYITISKELYNIMRENHYKHYEH